MAHAPNPNLQLFIDRLASRSVLTDAEVQSILGLPCHAQQVHANLDFVRLGESVDHASLIVAGLVGRFDVNFDGARQITAIYIAGDMSNLHSVVQPEATSALQSLSTATILNIPHSAIRIAAARHPALAEALWRDCMVDSAILAQWVVNVGRRDARSRIAHLLCELAARQGLDDGANRFTFPFEVTQAQLADATGLTPVHVNRTLRALRADQLADVRRGEVEVLDRNGLVVAGDFDAGYLQQNIHPQDRLRIVPAG